jgi:hypothetical protein
VKFAASNYYWEPLFEPCFSKEKPAKVCRLKTAASITVAGIFYATPAGRTCFFVSRIASDLSLEMIIGKNPSLL